MNGLKYLLIVALTMTIHLVKAQRVIQERKSLSIPYTDNDGLGVASATVNLDYNVKRMDENVLFSLSYSQITINAEAGYHYKGKKYGNEVPGLIEKLRTTEGSFPTVTFDIYYGSNKQGSFTYAISARNDLGTITGDFYTFSTTKDKLDNPNWRLVPTGFTKFNYKPNVTIWMELQDLIVNYERDKKDKNEYDELIRTADRLFNANKLDEALKAYYPAANHRLADNYPKAQIEKIKTQLAKDENKTRYANLISFAKDAESKKDYSQALTYYNDASQMGVNNDAAKRDAARIENMINTIKAEQALELKRKAEEEKQKLAQIEAETIRKKEEASRILQEREEEIQRKNEEEQDKLTDLLDRQERQRLNAEIEEKRRLEEEMRQRIAAEERQKELREEKDRRAWDDQTILKNEEYMAYNPVLFKEKLAEGNRYYQLAIEIDPYAALELKNEWWDTNFYMESFRGDLNEPRRQEAWKKSQELLYDMEANFANAKALYVDAIKHTDYESQQHLYLLDKIESINRMIDYQKKAIKESRKQEEFRQADYQTAKAYKQINRLNDNRIKAEVTYQVLTQDYLYPNLNSRVSNSQNALQRQFDFERRLNEADQQLLVDNAITGTTTQLAMSAILDDSKTTELYDNHSMGLNLFLLTGLASYPVVANDIPTEGKIPETFAEGLAVMPIQIGADWWLQRSKNWDIGLTGDLLLGVLPVAGYSDFLVNYGLNLKLNAGIQPIKLALEADIHSRSGSYKYDQGVATTAAYENIGLDHSYIEPSDRVLQGKLKYSTIKVGGGLHINISDKYSDGYVRLLMYAEKPSFYQNFDFKKPVYSSSALVVFPSGITVSMEYSKNYPVAGKAEYPMYQYTDRDQYRFTVGKTWTVGRIKY